MPLETPRAARRVLVTILVPMLLLVLVSIPLALDHKQTEYLVARELGESGLPLFDQAAVATLVQKVSDFDTGATTSDGRRGLLLLDAATARRHGLRVVDEASVPPRTVARRLRRPAPDAAAIVADERLDPAAHLRVAIADYREGPQRPGEIGLAIAAVQRLVLNPRQAKLLTESLLDPQLPRRLDGKSPITQLDELTAGLPTAVPPSSDPALTGRLGNQLLAYRHQIDLFSRSLPMMQARPQPTPVEYLNALKDVLAQVLHLEKWALHFLFGGCLFFAALALAILRGAAPAVAAKIAAALVLALAVTVELIDWRDAMLNGKDITLAGSLMDIVVTCVVPVLSLVWYRARSRGSSSPNPSR